MRQKVLNHLCTRPIAPIVENSQEKGTDIALKIMCILDHRVEKSNLYERIKNETNQPKLLYQLMHFRYFGSFKFYEYLKKSMLSDKLLKCEICEFTAPYLRTLEHMVLSHDRHKSSTVCLYCNQLHLKEHNQQPNAINSLENCYMRYREKNNIQSENLCSKSLIDDFYKLMTRIAIQLGVRIQRNDYSARRYKQNDIETIEIVSDDDLESISNTRRYNIVHPLTSHRSSKSIDLKALDDMFQKAMSYFNVSLDDVSSDDVALNDTAKITKKEPIKIDQNIQLVYGQNAYPNKTKLASHLPIRLNPTPRSESIVSADENSFNFFPEQMHSEVPVTQFIPLITPLIPPTSVPPHILTPPLHDDLKRPIERPNMGPKMSETNTANAPNMTNGMNNDTDLTNFITYALRMMSSESAARAKREIKQLLVNKLNNEMSENELSR